MKTNGILLLALLLSLSLWAIPAYALRNPSAVYCQSLGYTYETRETPEGTVGSCRISGSVECNAWDFLQGKCGTDYSYCASKGYKQKAGTGRECGVDSPNARCLLCILPDGSSREVSGLMDLNVAEGRCGDGSCTVGENYQNCPKDCPVGPKTIKYKYWGDLENETAATVTTNEKGHVSTTVPTNNVGSSASSFYIILVVLVLLIVLFFGLKILKNQGKR